MKGECFIFSGRGHGVEVLENVSRLIQLLKVITAVKREALQCSNERLMLIKKTWHLQSNFALRIHVHGTGFTSIMDTVVKYSESRECGGDRKCAKILGRDTGEFRP